MADSFSPELTFGNYQSGIMTPTSPGKPYRTIQNGFTPGNVANLVGWWEARDASTVGNGNPVSSLADRSASGANLAQATGSKQPLLSTTGGFYSLLLDGIDDYMAVNNAALRVVGDLTVVMVMNYDTIHANPIMLACQTNAGSVNAYECSVDTGSSRYRLVDANGGFEFGDSPVGSATPLGGWKVISYRRAVASSLEISANKTRYTGIALTKTPTANASSTFTLGTRISDLAGPFGGNFAAAFVYDRYITDGELNQVETYGGALAGLSI